ncbi:MAG: hypothetical protein R3185_02500 [Candidatus Thermoplasmatota archaeon]|nr:hypothetical protein [Candidatus Thermoplasmatota archaeon]
MGPTMKILWYADFDGTDDELAAMNEIFSQIVDELGGTVEGPFYPQDASLMYIIDCPQYEWLNESGRRFLPKVQEKGIQVTPVRYEVAVTPEEFWGEA